jgi:homoserine dehydrogenase
MKQMSLALLGFGNVGKAFAALIQKKKAMLEDDYHIQFIVTGIYTARHGYAINPAGIELSKALEVVNNGQNLRIISDLQADTMDAHNFITSCSSEFLLESTPLNPYTGQPAISYLKTALTSGKHVVTANKGPVVYGNHELSDMASVHGKAFYYESSVMDGAPIFSLFRDALPAVHVRTIDGILNSCTNYLLGLMEQGIPFERAVTQAQSIGITESDPSADIDGWDASVKLSALVTILFGIPLSPAQVDRTGIREITPEMINEASAAGEKWKLICSARRKDKNLLHAIVNPKRVAPDSPYFNINGTSSYVQFETDVLPGLGIIESNPSPETTAYGMLADVLNIIKKYS